MDATRFDALTRRLAGTTRRGALRLAAGGGLSALIMGLRPGAVVAKCVSPGKKCKKKGKKRKCCGGARCQGKKCVCPEGTFVCGKNCCINGQLCNLVGLACIAGAIPVGSDCDPELPGECASTKCGCNGALCVCREEDCIETGEECSGNLDCCQGVCNNDQCVGD